MSRLQNPGLSIAAYHAGLNSLVRAQVQKAFQRETLQIMVATVTFVMVINKLNIRFVIYFYIPRAIESYYQETSRSGRDSLPAKAMLLYNPSNILWLWHCLEEKPVSEQQNIEHYKLNLMGVSVEVQTCRRLILLNYFGEYRSRACNNCDICLNHPEQYNRLIDTQKVCYLVLYIIGQKFSLRYIVAMLLGSGHQRIHALGHDKLLVYGICREKTSEHWASILRQLIHLGKLRQNIDIFCTTVERGCMVNTTHYSPIPTVLKATKMRRIKNILIKTVITHYSLNFVNYVNRWQIKLMFLPISCLTMLLLLSVSEQISITVTA